MGDYNVFHIIPWSGAYAIYFFVIGISAAMFFFSALSWYRAEFQSIRMQAFYTSFALLAAGGLLLIGDLSQPLRFMNTMNPAYLNFTSPLAWGSLNLISFGLVSVAYFMTMRKNDEAMSRKLAVLGALLGAVSADLYRLRPDRAPEPSGVEHAVDAGAVRRTVPALGRCGGHLHRQGREDCW